MKSPFNPKKTISSNLQLILLHSAFTPIKFSPTYLHQKNIQSRGQNQGKRTKENLKSNSRSNFSIREVLYTAISLWTIETFLIAQEGYYENLDAKSPCGEQYVSNLRDTCPWGYSWFEFQQGKGLNLQSTAAMDSLNAILVDGALFDEVVSFWWDGRSLDEFSRFLFMLARAHEPHQRSPRLSACFWIRPPHSHNYHELRWTFFLSLFLSLLPDTVQETN